jgi:colanic acid biosynthesis glycosyl transferase WcaI
MASVGEAAAMLETAGAGLVVPPEDPTGLATAIRTIKSEPQSAERMGSAGRAYAVEHLDRTKLARRLEEVLLRLVAASGRSTGRARPSQGRRG